MTERLTTLAAVKEWLAISSDASDSLLLRLIDAASRFTLTWLNRDTFQVREYTQNFRGNGKNTMLLQNWPVLSVSSVGTGGVSISASPMGNVGLPGSGYVVSDARGTYQSLNLYGYGFISGAPSQVIYTAGFRATDVSILPAAVGSIVTYTPTTGGQWSKDVSVKVNGQTLTYVASATPPTGSYTVDEWGTYIFNANVAAQSASITYDYTPFDVSFAVAELIGEWYKRRDRIGILSKTLGGQETVTFSQKDMGESIKSALQPYSNVVPL